MAKRKNRRYYQHITKELRRLGVDASACVAPGSTAPAIPDGPALSNPAQEGDQQDTALFADPQQYDADSNLVARFGLSRVAPEKLAILQERMVAVGSSEQTKPDTMVRVYDQLRKTFEKSAELEITKSRHAAPLVAVDNRRQSVTIEESEPEPEPAPEIDVHPTVDISRRQQLAVLMRDLFESHETR